MRYKQKEGLSTMWHGKLHHGPLKNMQGERKAMQQMCNDRPLRKGVQK